MAMKDKAAIYLMFGIPGLLLSGALQTEADREAQRKKPYYVETRFIDDDVLVRGFDTEKDARKYAAGKTAGMYRLNGELNDMEAMLFENGRHVETIKSGLSESEYDKIKAERENKDDKDVKGVVAFKWK
ncbi:MAG: hypothetical protein LBI08_01595 [Methanomassiliicoccaceae archaeon]|nr:hypothetical protein [Methanomassiliicoccaceae archaeon]